MKQIRTNNRNDLHSNFNIDDTYLVYVKYSTPTENKWNIRFMKWYAWGFESIIPSYIGNEKWYPNMHHARCKLDMFEIFKLDRDEILFHIVTEEI